MPLATNCCLPRLQTKGNTDARGLTAQEYTAKACNIHHIAYDLFRRDPAEWGHQLRFSWDHASAHDAALPDIDLLPEQVLDIPVRSPDIHRVVESPHSIIHRTFVKRLAQDPRTTTVTQAIKLLQLVAEETVTKAYIQKLVKALPKTFWSIIENRGDWADKPFR